MDIPNIVETKCLSAQQTDTGDTTAVAIASGVTKSVIECGVLLSKGKLGTSHCCWLLWFPRGTDCWGPPFFSCVCVICLGVRQYTHHCEYTCQDEEVFVAEQDPKRRKLYRATLVTKKNGLKSNMIGMFLRRSIGFIDGAYSAHSYLHKKRNDAKCDKMLKPRGLKAGSYFVTEQVLAMLDEKARTKRMRRPNDAKKKHKRNARLPVARGLQSSEGQEEADDDEELDHNDQVEEEAEEEEDDDEEYCEIAGLTADTASTAKSSPIPSRNTNSRRSPTFENIRRSSSANDLADEERFMLSRSKVPEQGTEASNVRASCSQRSSDASYLRVSSLLSQPAASASDAILEQQESFRRMTISRQALVAEDTNKISTARNSSSPLAAESPAVFNGFPHIPDFVTEHCQQVVDHGTPQGFHQARPSESFPSIEAPDRYVINEHEYLNRHEPRGFLPRSSPPVPVAAKSRHSFLNSDHPHHESLAYYESQAMMNRNDFPAVQEPRVYYPPSNSSQFPIAGQLQQQQFAEPRLNQLPEYYAYPDENHRSAYRSTVHDHSSYYLPTNTYRDPHGLSSSSSSLAVGHYHPRNAHQLSSSSTSSTQFVSQSSDGTLNTIGPAGQSASAAFALTPPAAFYYSPPHRHQGFQTDQHQLRYYQSPPPLLPMRYLQDHPQSDPYSQSGYGQHPGRFFHGNDFSHYPH
eukprot:TRINITY_DN9691_c0_g1_i2.p1 TRINITY_DN9691_c0_g1~~TRINITY_DN9691_c0_g1_i2.p1  ORF type:complete len:691 (-),score=116.95 TRINITY_DN9691_c0_g1_i2:1133-3205(-)